MRDIPRSLQKTHQGLITSSKTTIAEGLEAAISLTTFYNYCTTAGLGI